MVVLVRLVGTKEDAANVGRLVVTRRVVVVGEAGIVEAGIVDDLCSCCSCCC